MFKAGKCDSCKSSMNFLSGLPIIPWVENGREIAIGRDAPTNGTASYSVSVNEEDEEVRVPSIGVGLCENCRFMKLIRSDRGSMFYFCERSTTDPAYPKYPRLPVSRCQGYEPVSANELPPQR